MEGEQMTYATKIEALIVERDALRAELAEWGKLRDPVVLHANLLRGFPALLSRAQLLHIAGDELAAKQAAPMTQAQLRESFYATTGCTLGGDIGLARKVCSAVEKYHGITAARPAPVMEAIPFRAESWPVDADGHAPTLCSNCGTPVRYGSRHVRCEEFKQPAPVAQPDLQAFANWVRDGIATYIEDAFVNTATAKTIRSIEILAESYKPVSQEPKQ